jgi:hypothetical protein
MFSEYEDKVEPRLRSALVPVVLGVAGGLVVGIIPGIVLAVLSGLVLMPGDVKRYYQELHQSFLGLNDTISKVKGLSCWTAADLQEWRNFRDSWAKFYGTGPSTTWLILSSDFDTAKKFAEGLVTWRQKVVDQCGGKPKPEPSSSWFMWALIAAGAVGVYFYFRPKLRVR